MHDVRVFRAEEPAQRPRVARDRQPGPQQAQPAAAMGLTFADARQRPWEWQDPHVHAKPAHTVDERAFGRRHYRQPPARLRRAHARKEFEQAGLGAAELTGGR